MTTRKLVRTALFAALTAVGAFLKIPLGTEYYSIDYDGSDRKQVQL